jgi:hypothetical protein
MSDPSDPARGAPDTEDAEAPRYKPITRGEGVTEAERYLQDLCERSFLRLWSYPGVYREQGVATRKEGKEVCDLLVVFGDDIVIFSDKHCAFPDSGDLEQDWSRWFRKAVMDSAKQIWGAERWILDHPERLYLDRACTQPFPIALPPRERARIHRVVVAHAVSERSRAFHGGTGSLVIMPAITGEMHYRYPKGPVMPFAVGDLDPARGFVHVLDDQSLDAVLRTLDTISDFVEYLSRKEELIREGRLLAAAGEDELLAVYLTHFDGTAHYFPVPEGATVVYDEGFWEDFESNPQRIAQVEANRISYLWDALIEEFGTHMLGGTSSFRSHEDMREIEPALRYMAAESRTRRRMLAAALAGALEAKLSTHGHAVRVAGSKDPQDVWYVFLALEPEPGDDEEEYRRKRRNLLESYCLVARYKNPEVPVWVGLAMEPRLDRATRSEDVLAFAADAWGPEQEERARELAELGVLKDVRLTAFSYSEYPDVTAPHAPLGPAIQEAPGKNPRNKPCPCGSGKKYKKCCGA